MMQLLYCATSCFLMESSHQHPLEKTPNLVDNPGSANTLLNGRMWNCEAEQVFAFLVFLFFFILLHNRSSLQVLIYNKTRFAMFPWQNLYCFSKVSKGKQYKCLNRYKSAEHKAVTALQRHWGGGHCMFSFSEKLCIFYELYTKYYRFPKNWNLQADILSTIKKSHLSSYRSCFLHSISDFKTPHLGLSLDYRIHQHFS